MIEPYLAVPWILAGVVAAYVFKAKGYPWGLGLVVVLLAGPLALAFLTFLPNNKMTRYKMYHDRFPRRWRKGAGEHHFRR